MPHDGERDESLHLWRETVQGLRDSISTENEEHVRLTIVDVCRVLGSRAEKAIEALDACACSEDVAEALRVGIRTLWREDAVVARSVVSSVLSGTVF